MQVRVYYNLHRKEWSVQNKIPGKGWRIFYHTNTITLENVTWKVSAAGRARVLREKRKNVHAFAIGDQTTIFSKFPSEADLKPVSYNPYKMETFQSDGLPITQSSFARFQENRAVLACNSR